MTEQDAREALRERLAEALRRDRDVNLPMNDPLDVSITDVVNALLPAVEEYAAERAEAAEAKVAGVEAGLTDRMSASLPLSDWALDPLPSCPNYAHVNPDWLRELITEARNVRAALDGSPAGSGGEEAGR